MDAKSKANFINSVANGDIVVCPKCGTQNNKEFKFCLSCGEELIKNNESDNAPAFAQVNDSGIESKEVDVKTEPESVFAQGLPSWSIEPPQVLVRRR